MSTEYLEINFAITAQKSARRRLTIPNKVCELLNLKLGDPIRLIIERANVDVLPTIEKRLTSGTEIVVETNIAEIESGERLTITASRPKG